MSETRKLEGAEYVGEAFPLGDRRYVVAHPDKQPYIFDFKTGETEEIKPMSPDSIYLTCGHIIVVDGTSVSLDDTKAPLHECCVKAIAGDLAPK